MATTGDGVVAGHAPLTRCHIDETPAPILAPCTVLPPYQRTGAGSSAVHGASRAATERDETFVLVPGHPAY